MTPKATLNTGKTFVSVVPQKEAIPSSDIILEPKPDFSGISSALYRFTPKIFPASIRILVIKRLKFINKAAITTFAIIFFVFVPAMPIII